MDLKDVRNIRLLSQQLLETRFHAPVEMVRWMGAIQAQDYNMAKWALGIRLPHSTDKDVQSALDKGEILRTHVLRPTWHFVAADDIYWLLELSGPRLKASLASRYKELELSPAVFSRGSSILENVLGGGQFLSREELVAEFKKAKLKTDDNRAAHLLMFAELDGLICSGPLINNKQSYGLLEERVPRRPGMPRRDEALWKLATRYFSSHGPATIYDFSWWSGLNLTEAKRALEMIKSEFVSRTVASDTLWFTDRFNTPVERSVFLLPAFDEFIISYKNRSASLMGEEHKKAIMSNGIFRPVVVVNGKVTGVWKRTVRKEQLVIDAEFLQHHTQTVIKLIEQSAQRLGRFIGKQPVIRC